MQPKKEKRKAGRYTKLTPELQQEFIAAIESGLTNKSACDYVGIDESTFYAWLNIARKAELEAAENGTKIPKNIKPFSEFSKSLKKAEARFKAYHCKNIKRAGDEGAWQASAWLLERKFPEEYGKNRDAQLINMNSTVIASDKADLSIISSDDLNKLAALTDEELEQLAGLLEKTDPKPKSE